MNKPIKRKKIILCSLQGVKQFTFTKEHLSPLFSIKQVHHYEVEGPLEISFLPHPDRGSVLGKIPCKNVLWRKASY